MESIKLTENSTECKNQSSNEQEIMDGIDTDMNELNSLVEDQNFSDDLNVLPPPSAFADDNSNNEDDQTMQQDQHNLNLRPDSGSNNKFYENAKFYWSKIPATVDGMLGGYGIISNIDIKGSESFLNSIFKIKSPPNKLYALDCGAGIGRITKNLLLPMFHNVDIIEQDKKFTDKIKFYINSDTDYKRIGKISTIGLQDYEPDIEAKEKYDIIWCQWVLGHLTDEDLVKFFKCIQYCLNKNGLLIIKENVTSSNSIELDNTDSSMTRSLKMLQKLIELSNYRIIKMIKQTNFPKGLYPVYIFACKPK